MSAGQIPQLFYHACIDASEAAFRQFLHVSFRSLSSNHPQSLTGTYGENTQWETLQFTGSVESDFKVKMCDDQRNYRCLGAFSSFDKYLVPIPDFGVGVPHCLCQPQGPTWKQETEARHDLYGGYALPADPMGPGYQSQISDIEVEARPSVRRLTRSRSSAVSM